ncbi:MAG TPA: NAD-dependent deacylase [Thermomicrobiales bacterium]|nr:NAD-dependent deacylase [Thermomicrobiales bacterium]
MTEHTPDLMSSEPAAEQIAELARLLKTAGRVVVLTGAGISTESGIPDYRGPNGIWATGKPPTIGDFMDNEESRRAYWQRRLESYPELLAAQPNPAHRALVELEHAGKLSAIVTQNIDGLHQRAGSNPDLVIELHGSAHVVRCTHCGSVFSGEEIQQRLLDGDRYPSCPVCGGILRTATVLFGEPLPREALDRSIALTRDADLLLVVGSSLVVNPAAKLPLIAKRNGAPVVIVNRTETRQDPLADLRLEGSAGHILPNAINMALI